MAQNFEAVQDRLGRLLGSVDPPPAIDPAARVQGGGWSVSDRSWLTHTLSLFLPGSGQMLRGELALGLFFLSMIAFCGCVCWAILETAGRLAGTLPLLDWPVASIFWVLVGAYVLCGGLHVAGTLSAAPGGYHETRPARHPCVSSLASLLIPGWGQMLNGDRVRGGLFLAGVWIAAGIWISASQPASDMLNAFQPVVSPWESLARQPLVLWSARWTLPILIWTLAVYDAASSASGRRD